uniref:FAD-dependent oxidoreductase domain-containing protein 1 n=1 Tax=Davidia involucrata TaxID=16924 RepID=A0A5B7BZN5_DAVIN
MAASISLIGPNPNPKPNGVVFSPPKPYLCGSALNSCFFGNKFLCKSCSGSTQRKRSEPVRVSGLNPITASYSFDVVVIGAGIIGLSIARQFLLGSDLSVAVVDAEMPCFGATGAGQGYIWLVHKTPGSDKWELAVRSHKLWEMLAESIQLEGKNPLEILGWKKTGSLLIGRTPKESDMLKRRVEQLSETGLRAEFLSSHDLMLEEPALMVGKEGGAAFLPDDYQLDARRTVAFIEKANRHFASEGRYAEFYYEPATCLLRSSSSGEVEAVQTSKNTLYGKKAVVIAAGCWSGSLMHDLIRDSDIDLVVPVMPRKGHLLVLENFNSFQLNHGLMAAGYVDHEAATLHSSVSASGPVHVQTSSVSMTATMGTSGNLVLGSSRQFVGFNTEIEESIINHIWDHAGEFFPTLRDLSLRDLRKSREVRIGLRPYMPDGKPMIGPVPGLSNVFLAAGHEGEGLSLALGTAEMVADMVLGNPGKVDYAPFALQGRCCR